MGGWSVARSAGPSLLVKHPQAAGLKSSIWKVHKDAGITSSIWKVQDAGITSSI